MYVWIEAGVNVSVLNMLLLQLQDLVIVVEHSVYHFHLFRPFVVEVVDHDMVNSPEREEESHCLAKLISHPDP